jgi:GAF domain-containing protein/CheY-like chemotaxis protein
VTVVALWGAGAAALLARQAAQEEARVAGTVAAARAVVEEAQVALAREARILAREPAVVEGAARGDWAVVARSASPRMVAVTVERLADLLLVLDVGGKILVQVPALPRVAVPDLVPPPSPTTVLRVLDGHAWLLGVAPVKLAEETTVGVVVVGRRLQRFEGALAALPGHPAVVVAGGDRLVGTTHRDVPASGWLQALRAGAVEVSGARWLVRPMGSALGLWVAVPPAAGGDQRRTLQAWLLAALGLAVLGTIAGAWLARVPGRRARDAAARDRELDALHAMAAAVTDRADLVTTAQQSLEVACAVLRLDAGAVCRLDTRAGVLTPVAHRGITPAEIARMRTRSADATHAGEALRTGRPVVTDLMRSTLLEPEVREVARAAGHVLQLAAPIPGEAGPWGVLFLLAPARRAPGAEELAVLEVIARQVGLATARAALVMDAREKGRRLDTLTQLASTLTASISVGEVLERIVGAAVQAFGASEARVWLVDEGGDTVSLAAGNGGRAPVAGHYRFSTGEGLVGRVVASRVPLSIADLGVDPRVRNVDRVRAEGLVSFAGVPLVLADRCLGALTLASRERREHSDEEIALLQSLASHAAVALDNACRFADEARRRAQLAALLEINKRIAGAESTEALLTAIAEEAARLLAVDNAGFRLVEGGDLVIAGLAGAAGETMLRERIRIGESFSGWVVSEGRTIIAGLDEVPHLVPEHREADIRLGYVQFLGVPLRAGARIIGVLAFRARRAFTARDAELAEAFAGQAALALEHARLYREANRQAERMAALADVERLLAETLEPDVVARRVADSVRVLLQAHAASVYRLEPGDGELVALAVSHPDGDGAPWNMRLPAGHGVVGLAVRERATVVTADMLADPRITFTPEARARVQLGRQRAGLALPLVVRGRLIGGLSIAGPEGRRFDDDDVRLAQAFAHQAAVALENARLFDEAARQAQRMAALADVERLLSETLDPDVVAQRIVDSLCRLLAARSAALYGLDADAGDMSAVTVSRDVGATFHWAPTLPAGQGLVGLAVALRRPAVSADVLADSRLRYADELRASIAGATHRALLTVPLRVRDRVLGALAVGDRTGRQFAEEEVRLAQAFADQAAMALENARLFSAESARRTQIEALAAVERELAAELDLDRLLGLVVDRASRLFAGHGIIYLADASGATLVPAAWTPDVVSGRRLAVGEGVSGLCAARRRGVLDNDYARSPHAVAEFVAVSTARSMSQPLLVRDRLLGALNMSRRGDDAPPFSADDLAVLESFATQAAIVMENARLHAQAERRRDEAEALARVARTLTESLEVSAVGARIVESVVALLSALSGGLRLLTADGSLVAIAFQGPGAEHFAPGHVQPPGTGLAGLAVAEARAVWSPDILTDARFVIVQEMRERMLRYEHRAALAVPLQAKGRTIGVLLAVDRVGRVFTEAELALAGAFADQAALALDNARLHEEAEERRREAEVIATQNASLYETAEMRAARVRTLAHVNRVVSSSLDTGEVLAAIARAASELMDSPFVSFWVADEAARTLALSAVSDPTLTEDVPLPTLAFGEGIAGRVASERRAIDIPDIAADERFVARDWARAHGIVSFRALPIVQRGALLGVLGMCGRGPFQLASDDEGLLDSFVAQAGVALDHARLYAETRGRLEQTRALLEVAEILNATLDQRQLLKRVTIKTAQVCGVDRCSLELWDGDRVIPLMSQFADGHQDPGMWAAFIDMPPYPPREVPVHARALESRRAVIIEDASDTDLLPREWVEAFHHKSYMAVPLIRQDQVIGVMSLDYCETVTPFQRWQVDLATAIAGQLALSLENARLYAEAQERLRETTTLLAVSQALAHPGPAEDVMRRVARELARALGADMTAAYAAAADGATLQPLAGYHVPPALRSVFTRHAIVLARFPFVRDAAREGRAAWSADPLADDRFDREWIERLPAHSVVFAPMRLRGETVGGLFVVWWRAGRAFGPAEIRLIEAVAQQIGLALENAELARQREQRLKETETLLAVSRALSSTLELDPLLRQVMRQIARAIGADCVGIWMLDETREWLTPVAGYRVPRPEEARRLRLSIVRHAFYAEAARTGRPVSSHHVAGDPRIAAELFADFPHESQLFAPVLAKDRMIGGFVMVWWQQPRHFTDSELALIETIASQAGVAIENARLFQQNRRQVEELSVLNELSRAVTGQLDFAALLDTLRASVLGVFDAQKMEVLLVAEPTDEFEVVLQTVDGVEDATPARRCPRTVGLASLVLDTGRTFRSDDYVAECARRGLALPPAVGPRYWIGAPMRAGEATLGVLTVSRRDRPFAEADERLLDSIADLAALAVRSARLFEERTRAYGELAAAQDHLVRTEKLRALGEMASGVAHDFNNLLSAILGRTQLLLRQVTDDTLRRWLEVVEKSALDGAQTVRRLQDFARVRRDQPRVAVNLNDVVRDALDITQSRWRDEVLGRGLSLEVRAELAPVPAIAGDPSELREAMTNLILNAVDAMPDGGRLTLSTGAADDQVEVRVADTGTGIPAEVREKIFDPFFTTKGPRGTGLGLSMTYGIVARHGGAITVESEPGRGSVFRLRFPVARGTESPGTPPEAVSPEPDGLRCLVVDDEEPVGMVLGDILESLGHRAVVLADGAQAIDRLRAGGFDVVFTDLAMPGVSGWQVASAVKAAAPHVPVFMVTGFGVEFSAQECRTHGVDAVFPKPLKIEDLVEAMARVARHRGTTNRPEDR